MTPESELHFDASCPVCKCKTAALELSLDSRSLIRCGGCQVVYAWPRSISPTLYESAYDEGGVYCNYASVYAINNRVRLPWAMARFLNGVKPRGSLLDIGCSTGVFLSAAKRKGWTVSGIEMSSKAASIARDRTGAHIFVGSITDLKPKRSFDAITMWETLEHVEHPVQFLRSAVRLLNVGGVLAASVPNWGSPWMRRSRDPAHWPPYHLTFWDRRTIKDLMDRVGLGNTLVKEKPFAWQEEVGGLKWVYLPVALLRSAFMHQRGMHLYVEGTR